MKFEQLEQLLVISQKKSISKAARTLFLGQSTLSNSLHNLEEEIGVSLFERTPNGVEPTPECAEILILAKEILSKRDCILNMKNTSKDLYGTVTLHIVPGYGFLYSDILKRFQTRFPKASLKLDILSPEQILDSFKKGTTDIAMILCLKKGEALFDEYSLDYERFNSHKMLLFVGANHPLFQDKQVSPSSLQSEQFVSYSSLFWAKISDNIGLKSSAIVVQDRESLKRMISDGEAVALLPDVFAKKDLYCELGLIHQIPIEDNRDMVEPYWDHLVYPKKRQLTLLEQETLAMLRSLMEDMNRYESELKKETNDSSL